VFNPFDADELFGNLTYFARRSFYCQHFQAVMVIKVHMHGGKNQAMVIVLQLQQQVT
jgi:hypothetical protein